MSEAIVIAVIGLCGGVLTATIALIQNRLNRKDTVKDKEQEDIYETIRSIDLKVDKLSLEMSHNQSMAVLSVGDKLRHYGTKYLANPDVAYITAVKDWLKLEEAYEICGGNHHVKAM